MDIMRFGRARVTGGGARGTSEGAEKPNSECWIGYLEEAGGKEQILACRIAYEPAGTSQKKGGLMTGDPEGHRAGSSP